MIGGGGAAGVVQGITVLGRAASGVATAGIGNPIVSTVEWVAAIVVSILAIVVPILAIGLLIVCVVWIASRIRSLRGRRVRATELT